MPKPKTTAATSGVVTEHEQQPFNPISRWEEFEKIKGLTLYDINRKPRLAADKDGVIVMPLRKLNSELTCPICLSILRNTMIVMECLHRFCSECIQKCLRVGRKECPACRKHVPSRRSLRRDQNFDSIITKIYPDLDAFEHKEGKYIAKINQMRNVHNAFTESCQQGIKTQQESRRRWRWGKPRGKKSGGLSASTATATSSDVLQTDQGSNGSPLGHRRTRGGAGTGTSGKRRTRPPPSGALLQQSAGQMDTAEDKRRNKRRKHPMVGGSDERGPFTWFVLTQHPADKVPANPLQMPLIGAMSKLQVRHMKSYIAKQLGQGLTLRRLQISLAQLDVGGKPTQYVLDDKATLDDIKDITTLKNVEDPIVLHYSISVK